MWTRSGGILLMLFLSISFIESAEAQNTRVQNISAQRAVLSGSDLVAVLDSVYRSEQEPIRLRDSFISTHGADSEQAQAQQKIYERNHVINERKVRAILDSHGWPAKSVIGEQGNLTISNVLQHSANDIRIKYLPMMRQAVQEGNLHPRFLVRAEDRIATDRGDLQIYGGQMKYYPETKSFNVWPVFDPANIDERRAKIGLGPIADHLMSRFSFEWRLEEQLQRTREFEFNQKAAADKRDN